MSSEARVGGDVDAYCTRCKMSLGHTILAMLGSKIARARCNTCQGEHAYRAGPPGTASPKTKRASARTAKSDSLATSDLDELLEGRDTSNPKAYSLTQLFEKGEVVNHSSFGMGVVVEVRGDRFDVVFRGGLKTLAQRKAQESFVKRHDHAIAAERVEEMDVEDSPAGMVPEPSSPSVAPEG